MVKAVIFPSVKPSKKPKMYFCIQRHNEWMVGCRTVRLHTFCREKKSGAGKCKGLMVGFLICLNRTSQYHNHVLNVPSAKCVPYSSSALHSPVKKVLRFLGFAFVMEYETWTDIYAVRQGTS